MKKVSVIGLGYVGLPTAILAAQAGLKVVGVDLDKKRVDAINSCSAVVEEPEIIEHLHEVCGTHNFYATTELEPADYFVVAVPTPITEQKRANLKHVADVAHKIADVLKKGDTIILESTVPVGTTRSFAEVIAKESGLEIGKDFFVSYCPERVLPGNIFKELKVNDRVIGGIDQNSIQKAAEFYKYFVSGDLYLTDVATAEMVKLIENSSRDVNIAFAQQVAAMAEQEGLDPFEIIELANKHPRVSLLRPSCGVGGHCIAVDPYFLIESYPENTGLLKSARQVNNDRTTDVLKSIKAAITDWKQTNQGKCSVLVLGLTYKANIDDLRESPAYSIAQELLQEERINLSVCDPHVAKTRLKEELQERMVSLFDGIEVANLLVCLVEHEQFKIIDKRTVAEKTVLDFCGLFFKPRTESIDQEQFFWPASTPTTRSYKKKEETELRSEKAAVREEQL